MSEMGHFEANLNADAYRLNQKEQDCKDKAHKQFDILEVYSDDTTILCMNDLTGRYQNGCLKLYKNVDDCLHDVPLAEINSNVVLSAAVFVENNVIFASEETGNVKLLSLDTYDQHNNRLNVVGHAMGHDDMILCVSKLYNRNLCCTGGGEGDLAIKVWDTAYKTNMFIPIHNYAPAHSDYVSGLAANPLESNIFVSASNDKNAIVWDIREPYPATDLYKNDFGLTSIDWQPGSSIMAMGNINGDVICVDLRSPNKCISNIHIYEAPLHNVKFNPTSSSLIGCCADTSEVKVLDLSSGDLKLIYENDHHEDMVRGIAWKWHSQDLITCGYDNQILKHTASISNS